MHHAKVGLLAEFLAHTRHSPKYGQPVQFPRLVQPDTDEKKNELSLDLAAHTPVDCQSHLNPPYSDLRFPLRTRAGYTLLNRPPWCSPCCPTAFRRVKRITSTP